MSQLFVSLSRFSTINIKIVPAGLTTTFLPGTNHQTGWTGIIAEIIAHTGE